MLRFHLFKFGLNLLCLLGLSITLMACGSNSGGTLVNNGSTNLSTNNNEAENNSSSLPTNYNLSTTLSSTDGGDSLADYAQDGGELHFRIEDAPSKDLFICFHWTNSGTNPCMVDGGDIRQKAVWQELQSQLASLNGQLINSSYAQETKTWKGSLSLESTAFEDNVLGSYELYVYNNEGKKQVGPFAFQVNKRLSFSSWKNGAQTLNYAQGDEMILKIENGTADSLWCVVNPGEAPDKCEAPYSEAVWVPVVNANDNRWSFDADTKVWTGTYEAAFTQNIPLGRFYVYMYDPNTKLPSGGNTVYFEFN